MKKFMRKVLNVTYLNRDFLNVGLSTDDQAGEFIARQ
jgi:hypothetical protein